MVEHADSIAAMETQNGDYQHDLTVLNKQSTRQNSKRCHFGPAVEKPVKKAIQPSVQQSRTSRMAHIVSDDDQRGHPANILLMRRDDILMTVSD